MSKRLYAQLGASMVVRVGGAAASLFLTIYIARVMGAEDAGRFFWATNLVIGFGFVCRWGLDTVLMKMAALDGADLSQASALLIKGLVFTGVAALVTGVMATGVALGFSNDLFPDYGYLQVFVLAMISLVPYALMAPVCGLLRGLQKQGAAAFVEKAGQSFILLALVYILTLSGKINANTAMIANVVSCVLVLVIGIYLTGLAGKRTGMARSSAQQNEMVKSGGAMVVNNLAGFMVNWGCGIMLAWYAAASEVAVFAGAQRIASAIAIVFAVFANTYAAYMPVLYAKKQVDELQRLLRNGVRNMLLVSIPVIAPMIIAPAWVMKLLGSEYEHGGTYLVIMACGQVITSITGLAGSLLAMAGKEKVLRDVGVVVAILMILLGGLVIPGYGAMGAAIVTAIGMVIQGLVFVAITEKGLGIRYLR